MDLRRAGRILRRGIRLRCPRCGAGTLFRNAFSMHPECANCHLWFEREQGYFVGAIHINYAVTASLLIVGFFTVDYVIEIPLLQQLLLGGAFCLVFPVCFFRYAKSLWVSVDFIFDPPEATDQPRRVPSS